MFKRVLALYRKIHNNQEITKTSIIKNYSAFSISFLLIFTAINGVQSVQSILNSVEYVGIVSQILFVAIQLPLSITIPTIFIETFGIHFLLLKC